MKKELNLMHKPHVFLAKKNKKKKDSKKYIVSVAIPVCSAFIKSIKKHKYDSSIKYMKDRLKDCDIYVIKVQEVEINGDKDLNIAPIPPFQFIGAQFHVKRDKDKIAILIKGVTSGTNGHEKDAIHVYDDASEPIYQ